MNNFTLYIFGNFGAGCVQYPNDYAVTIFSKLGDFVKTTSVLAVLREGDLMYYCYRRKLDGRKKDEYVGFCAMLNGVALKNVSQLFNVFEHIIEFMVSGGYFIGFDPNGNIKAVVSSFTGKERDVEMILTYLKRELFDFVGQKLPSVSYGMSRSESISFNVSDDETKIFEASCKYGCTFVYKDKDCNTVSINSYKNVLAKLNETNKDLLDKNGELQRKYNKVVKQKQQTQLVSFLLVALAICAFIAYNLFLSIDKSRKDLDIANNTIEQRNDTIKQRNEMVRKQRKALKDLENHNSAIQLEFLNFQNTISGYQPFLVDESTLDFNTGEFSFAYYGLKEGIQNLSVHVVGPEISIGQDFAEYINEGKNMANVKLEVDLNREGYYYVYLYYNGKIIGGNEFLKW